VLIPARIRSLWRNLVHRSHVDREFDEEVRSYLDQLVAKNINEGMAPDEARRAAQISLGGIEQVKERVRDARAGAWLASLNQDLRYGLRQLRRNPAFTIVAAVMLALGIGANTAIFSVVDAVLLRALPFKNPGQLVMIWETEPSAPTGRFPVAGPDFKNWLAQNKVFQGMAAGFQDTATLTGSGEPLMLTGDSVSPRLFQLMGVQPLYGRAFASDESQPGRDHVLILSYGLWRQAFGANPAIVGKTVTLSGEAYDVIGVMPPSLHFPEIFGWKAEYWVPINFEQPAWKKDRSSHWLWVMARIKPGVTLAQARADMETISARIERQYPKTNTGVIAKVRSLRNQLTRNIRPALLVLFAAVGFLLLIACVNVVNLLLARAVAREREIAVRLAVGSGRWRLVRQLLTESVLLFVIGGFGGLAVGWGALRLLLHATPAGYIPNVTRVSLNSSVFLFTLLIAFLSGTLGGLLPAVRAARVDLQGTLKEGGYGRSSPRQRARSSLTIAEIALALVMLVGSGLAIRSLVRLLGVKPGFDARNVLTLSLSLPDSAYPKDAQVVSFYQRLLDGVRALPGVLSAAAGSELPLQGGSNTNVYVEGQPLSKNMWSGPLVEICYVTPTFFHTLHIPLLRGRDFTLADRKGSMPVTIINQTMAREFWPHQNAVGKRLTTDYDHPKWTTVVGVVGNARVSGLDSGPMPEAYFPEYQESSSSMSLVIRTATPPPSLISSVRQAVRTIDKELPISDVRTLSQIVSQSSAQQRFLALLLTLFASIAVVLAAIGIYGVVAYSVASRQHEIGIRMALGAQRQDVLRLVLFQGLKLSLAGVVIGIAGAVGLTRFLSSLLYGIKPMDPLTFVVVSLVLIGVALLACYIPAQRAAKVDPMLALRYE
jgi:predicted permease